MCVFAHAECLVCAQQLAVPQAVFRHHFSSSTENRGIRPFSAKVCSQEEVQIEPPEGKYQTPGGGREPTWGITEAAAGLQIRTAISLSISSGEQTLLRFKC